MKKQIILSAILATAVLGVASTAHANVFVSGDLAVFLAAASASNTTGSIVELHTAAAGNPVQTIAINGTTTPDELRFSGSATSTGYLSHTADGTMVTFTGANSTSTSANVNTLNPRSVGAIDVNGAITLPTSYTGSSGNQTRSATSLDGTNWFISDQSGIYSNGTTSASPTGNTRAIKPFGGTVYTLQASSVVTTIAVATVSAPTGGTISGLTGLTNDSAAQDFYMISSGANGSAYDVLYVLDSTANAVGTIKKYSLVSGSWAANGSYATTFGGFGLAAAVDAGGGADLYLTTGLGALTGNQVLKVLDTAGYNTPISIASANNVSLYTAPAGTILKGIDFAPVAAVPEPASLGLLSLGALSLLASRKKR